MNKAEYLISANPTNGTVKLMYDKNYVYCYSLEDEKIWELEIKNVKSIKVLYKDNYTLKSYIEIVSNDNRYIVSENGKILNKISEEFGDKSYFKSYSILPKCYEKESENGIYDLTIKMKNIECAINCQIYDQFNNCIINKGVGIVSIKYLVDQKKIMLFSRHNVELDVKVEKVYKCNTIHILGDSTVANYDELPNFGWGQLLSSYVSKEYLVNNLACKGRSLKSCIYENIDEELLKKIKVNDVCLIQFGHNDQKFGSFGSSPEEFENLLYELCKKLLKKQINLVLVSPIERRNIVQDKFVQTLAKYEEAYTKVAKKLDLKLINLTKYTFDLYSRLGAEESKKLFVRFDEVQVYDNTHLNFIGADIIAKYVSKELLTLKKKKA